MNGWWVAGCLAAPVAFLGTMGVLIGRQRRHVHFLQFWPWPSKLDVAEAVSAGAGAGLAWTLCVCAAIMCWLMEVALLSGLLWLAEGGVLSWAVGFVSWVIG